MGTFRDGRGEAAGLRTRPRHLGQRIRARRMDAGISLRELARRVGVSASLISQIETDKVQPSVNTLYSLAAELGGSIDEIVFDEPPPAPTHDPGSDLPPGLAAFLLAHPPVDGIQRGSERKRTRLSGGVRWERLTPGSAPGVEFLYVVYEPGAESSPPHAFHRHTGREWAYVVSGRLQLTVGCDEFVLDAGDSLTYDSSTPHRLANPGDVPMEAVWFQLG